MQDVEFHTKVSPRQVLEAARSRQQEMVAFLKQLVQAESPSTESEAQHDVQALLRDPLEHLGVRVTHLPGRESGGHLYARPRSRERHRPVQLLLGPCDTVWPLGTLQEMPIEVRDGKMRRPGVFDMKGGLAQMIFALHLLQETGQEPSVTPVLFINSDEEIGSRESSSYIRMLARRADRALVLEPALGPAGKLKTSRRGGGRFTVRVRGKSAHAGLEPGEGASAILALAQVVQQLHALNDAERGISVNVGRIEGGVRPNMVAPESRAEVDVRVRTKEDAAQVEQAINSLEATTPGTVLEIEGRIARLPMEPTPRNRALWRVARSAGQSLGLELEEGRSGGGSDGNTTSQYTATLDGLGAVGDGAHASHEYVELDKMVERTALLTLLLLADPLEARGDLSSSNGEAMNTRYVFTSLTRIAPFAEDRFAVTPLPKQEWATGDYVACEVLSVKGFRKVELTSGRMREVAPGDVLVGALGARHATLEATGTWQAAAEGGRMHVLTSAGLIGKCTSRSPYIPALMPVQYTGHVQLGGEKATMRRFVDPADFRDSGAAHRGHLYVRRKDDRGAYSRSPSQRAGAAGGGRQVRWRRAAEGDSVHGRCRGGLGLRLRGCGPDLYRAAGGRLPPGVGGPARPPGRDGRGCGGRGNRLFAAGAVQRRRGHRSNSPPPPGHRALRLRPPTPPMA